MIMMLSSGAFTTVGATEKNPATAAKEIPAEIQVILNRLDKIKDMDKSDLNLPKRKSFLIKYVASIPKLDLSETVSTFQLVQL